MKDTTATAGGANVYNPANMQGNCADDLSGEIYSGSYNYHATAIATLAPNTGVTGRVFIYGWSEMTSGKGSHVFVFCAKDPTGPWYTCKDMYVNKNTPHYMDCGRIDAPMKYIAIACMNDASVSWMHIDSIGVYNFGI